MRFLGLFWGCGFGLVVGAAGAQTPGSSTIIESSPPTAPFETAFYVAKNIPLDTREGLVMLGGWPGQDGKNMKLCSDGEGSFIKVDLENFDPYPERSCGNTGPLLRSLTVDFDRVLTQSGTIRFYGADQTSDEAAEWVVTGLVPAQNADGEFAGLRAYVLEAADGADVLGYMAATGCSLNAAGTSSAALFCDRPVSDVADFATTGFSATPYAPLVEGVAMDTGIQLYLPQTDGMAGTETLRRFGREGFGTVIWDQVPVGVARDFGVQGGLAPVPPLR